MVNLKVIAIIVAPVGLCIEDIYGDCSDAMFVALMSNGIAIPVGKSGNVKDTSFSFRETEDGRRTQQASHRKHCREAVQKKLIQLGLSEYSILPGGFSALQSIWAAMDMGADVYMEDGVVKARNPQPEPAPSEVPCGSFGVN